MKTKQRFFCLLLLMPCISSAGVDSLTGDRRSGEAAKPTEPVAMISGYHGRISLKKDRQILDLFDELQAGQVIAVPRGSNLTVIYYRSGVKYLVSGLSEVRVGKNRLEPVSGNPVHSTKTPYRKRIIIRPSGLAQASAGMSAPVFHDRQKIHLQQTPEIRLHVIRIEPRAVFELYGSGGKTVWRKNLALNGYPQRLRIDASAGLRHGKTYKWVIYRASASRTVITHGSIVLADDSMVQKAALRRPAYDSDMSDKVLYAAWLESIGAADDAARYWRMLASKYNSSKRLTELAR